MPTVAQSLRPNNTVYVAPQMYSHGLRWHWVHHTHAGACDGWSRETFASEFDAALAAAQIAHCKEARLAVAPDVRERLIAHWNQLGRDAFASGLTLDRCSNAYQRRGWLEAEQEMDAFMEALFTKPQMPAYALEEAVRS